MHYKLKNTLAFLLLALTLAACSKQRILTPHEQALLDIASYENNVDEQLLPPISVNISQAFFEGEDLHVKVRVDATEDINPRKVRIIVRGLKMGEILESHDRLLSDVISQPTLEERQALLLHFVLTSEGLNEYQVVYSWGDDAKPRANKTNSPGEVGVSASSAKPTVDTSIEKSGESSGEQLTSILVPEGVSKTEAAAAEQMALLTEPPPLEPVEQPTAVTAEPDSKSEVAEDVPSTEMAAAEGIKPATDSENGLEKPQIAAVNPLNSEETPIKDGSDSRAMLGQGESIQELAKNIETDSMPQRMMEGSEQQMAQSDESLSESNSYSKGFISEALPAKVSFRTINVQSSPTECNTPPCDVHYSLVSELKNEGERVSGIQLAAGLIWTEGDAPLNEPAAFAPILPGEERVELRGVVLEPGAKKQLRIAVARAVPQLPFGKFLPYVRILGVNETGDPSALKRKESKFKDPGEPGE